MYWHTVQNSLNSIFVGKEVMNVQVYVTSSGTMKAIIEAVEKPKEDETDGN